MPGPSRTPERVALYKGGKKVVKKVFDKEKIRKKELTKLNRIFKELPAEKQKLAEGLKSQAAFMVATLAELQEILNKDGAVELFEQGAQKMLREHPAAKTYNTMVRNYTSICKALFDLLPEEEKKTAADELMEFVKGASKR
jgi:tellurite resistance protein